MRSFFRDHKNEVMLCFILWTFTTGYDVDRWLTDVLATYGCLSVLWAFAHSRVVVAAHSLVVCNLYSHNIGDLCREDNVRELLKLLGEKDLETLEDLWNWEGGIESICDLQISQNVLMTCTSGCQWGRGWRQVMGPLPMLMVWEKKVVGKWVG